MDDNLLYILVVVVLVFYVAMRNQKRDCPNCGEKISKSAQFCKHCGYEV